MSTKQRLASALAELPDSLSLEEAIERLYRAVKLKQAAQAVREQLQAQQSRRSFEEMYTEWRQGVDPNDLSDVLDDLAGAR